MVLASRLREEQRRSAAAERRVSELVARNAALIARLRRYEATDQTLIAAGPTLQAPPRPRTGISDRTARPASRLDESLRMNPAGVRSGRIRHRNPDATNAISALVTYLAEDRDFRGIGPAKAAALANCIR